MANLRLPAFLTDKNATSREEAKVRFIQENNVILKSQFELMSKMSQTLENIQQMMFLGLDYEKRKLSLSMERIQQEELRDIEQEREAGNERRMEPERSGFGISSLASTAATLGIKGMIGAVLFGLVAEFLDWGKKIAKVRDWFMDKLGALQDKLDEWFTGDGVLAGLGRSLIPITAGFTALAAIIGPGRISKMLPLGKIIEFFKSFGKIIPFLKELDGAKVMRFVRVFGRMTGVIGLIMAGIEGVIGGIQGMIKGYQEKGMVGIVEGWYRGFWTALGTGILETLQTISTFILDAIGLDKLAAALDNVDFGAIVNNVADGIGGVIDTITGFVASMFKAIMDFDYMGLIYSIIDKLPIPDDVKAAFKDGFKGAVQMVGTAKDFVVGKAGQAMSAASAGWDKLTGVVDSIDTTAANFLTRRTEEMGVAKKPTPIPSPITGSAATSMVESAAVNSTNNMEGRGGITTFDQAVEQVLKHEGGYVNDPNDRGGETKYGISKRSYPDVDIKNLTMADAKAIYKKDYWDAIGADDLPANIRYAAFDTAVNMGVGRARQFIRDSGGDLNKFTELRKAHYARIIQNDPSQAKFQRGWNNRVNDVAALSAGTSSARISATPTVTSTSGQAVSASTAAVSASREANGSATAVVAPKTSVTNNTTHHAANISAATPVEFAPHVI